MTRHPGIVFRALSWNLFHGRESTGAGPGRALLDEFVTVLAGQEWDVALLQEAPPRWFHSLCHRLGAEGVIAFTSRNFGSAVRGWIADRRPDLIKSNEGGSNQLLVRAPWTVTAAERLMLARWPERRRALRVRIEHEGAALSVVNLHASANRPHAAAREVLRAAAWAGGGPLLFGGDLNLRPAAQPAAFHELRERFGLAPPTAPDAIDHLLVRDLDVVELPRGLPGQAREVEGGRRVRMRLSDHAPVVATFAIK